MSRLFWAIRLFVKNAIVRAGFGDRLIEYCQDCGIHMPLVWWSPDDLWTRFTGHQPSPGDNMPGALCPRCFDARATRAGVLLRWYPTISAERL